MNNFEKTYALSAGDGHLRMSNGPRDEFSVAVQIETSDGFDGTTTTAALVQSNNIDTPDAQWHPLPETALVINTTDDSFLLHTQSHDAAHLGIRITAGDASAGTFTFTTSFKNQ